MKLTGKQKELLKVIAEFLTGCKSKEFNAMFENEVTQFDGGKPWLESKPTGCHRITIVIGDKTTRLMPPPLDAISRS